MSKYPENPTEIAHLLNEDKSPDPSTMTDKDIYHYINDVLRGAWPESEPYVKADPGAVLGFATDTKRRWLEAESYIVKEPYWAYWYAESVIKGRWPEAEPFIMRDPIYAELYAANVIKGPWPEAEPYMMKDPKAAYMYAKFVKGKWPEYEGYMSRQHPISDDPNPMDDHEDVTGDDWWGFYQQDFMND